MWIFSFLKIYKKNVFNRKFLVFIESGTVEYV